VGQTHGAVAASEGALAGCLAKPRNGRRQPSSGRHATRWTVHIRVASMGACAARQQVSQISPPRAAASAEAGHAHQKGPEASVFFRERAADKRAAP
jgi:hypothetical protein